MSNDHPDPPGERCYWPACTNPATHKVGEEGPISLHNMTTYLCCEHMQAIGCDCSRYPYTSALRDPFADVRGEVEQIGLGTLILTEAELKLLRRFIEGKPATDDEKDMASSLWTAVTEASQSARRSRRGDDG